MGILCKKHAKDVDWNWLEKVLDQFGIKSAYTIFNNICVEDLGFDALLFPKGKANETLKERILNEILQPEFVGDEPNSLLLRVIFKFHRRKANGWKNELCFKESMWSAFLGGVWGHLLKPASI